MSEIIEVGSDLLDESFISECVDKKINENLENESAIGMYAIDAVSVLTAIEARTKELEEQGVLSRLWNNVVGQNRKLNINNQQDLAYAQLLAQKMLDDLYKKNAISFELAITLGDKVNLIERDLISSKEKINKAFGDVSGKIQGVYHDLNLFFDKVKTKIESLESEFRRNDDLLFWKETLLEHNVYKGKTYDKLSDAQKIICVAKEFYEVTNGHWNRRDIAFLRSSLRSLDIQPDKPIKPIELVCAVLDDTEILEFFFSKSSLKDNVGSISLNAPLTKSFDLAKRIHTTEKHVIETIIEFAGDCDRKEVEISYISNVVLNKFGRDLGVEHGCFDVAVDLLGDFLLSEIECNSKSVAEKSIEYESSVSSKIDGNGYGYGFVMSALNDSVGFISDIYTREGDVVIKGQPLALLAPTTSLGEKLVFIVASEEFKVLSVNERPASAEEPSFVMEPVFTIDKFIEGNRGVFKTAERYFREDDIEKINISDLSFMFSGSTGGLSVFRGPYSNPVNNFNGFIDELKKSGLVSNFAPEDVSVVIDPNGILVGGPCSAMIHLDIVVYSRDTQEPYGMAFPFRAFLPEKENYVIISKCKPGVIEVDEPICCIVQKDLFPASYL